MKKQKSDAQSSPASPAGVPVGAASDAPPIVGIGASAGGLDAFLRLVQHLRPDAGLAYVLVQHLAPDHESMLPELLGRATAIPVVTAADGMRLAADHAYVIPPNATMTVTDGHLRLTPRSKARGAHRPVDAFLGSLARVHGPAAAGVILSGTGTDGAAGIEALKEAGGITFAQDSASAPFPGMPEAAVDTGSVDFVLSPEEIGEQLGQLGRHLARGEVEHAPADGPAHGAGEEDALQKILALLHRRTGVDFQHYRRGTVHRRIVRRMLVHRQETRTDYLAHVRLNPVELDLLYEDLLIGVTSFFRDPDVFDALRETGFPALMRARAPDAPIRVWVAGCSGGEEVYSLAIALLEYLGDEAASVPIQLFGTDLSEVAVARARAGLYPHGIEAHVSPERLRRFFIAEETGYRIAKAVRDRCVFSRQNLVRDPPFSHLDLISCRNVLIYLEPPLQQRVFPIFHYALEPHGLLLLGSAESPGAASEFFVPLVKRHKLYQRRATPARPLDVDVTRAVPTGRMGEVTGGTLRARRAGHAGSAPSLHDVVGEADRAVLARLAPAGVVLNERLEVLHFRGDTSRFLAFSPGAAHLDVLRLARPELVMALQLAIGRAASTDLPAREAHRLFAEGAATREVAIDVLPVGPASIAGRFFAVLFTEVAEPLPGAGAAPQVVSAADGGPKRPTAGARRREAGGQERGLAAAREELAGVRRELDAARDELAATRRYVQTLVEQYEATTQDLRAASEEVQASNEELQSTNEELETTKEEVQSANEELTTLNEELRHRNRELSAISADLTNVLTSTTIPIAIVGSDLRLRRFTPALARVMKVIPTDVGRPLGDVRLRVELPDLERLVEISVETLASTDREVQDDEGRWWALTVRPYQTADRRVDGAVLVFSDIDASKRAGAQAAAAAEERRELLDLSERARDAAEHANRAKGTFLASMSHDLRTPLNAIGGYVDLLDLGVRGPVTAAQREDYGRIKRSARHLLALINDILNFAKVEAGHLDLRIQDVAVAPVIEELEGMVAPQVAAKALRFEQGAIEGTVRADPEKLRQILINLVGNAVKFTARDGRITVTSVADGVAVHVAVADTGRGIAADQLERIFEPFVQLGRGLTTANPDGIGLGLAISRELARAMGGELAVESLEGTGSTFTLTLPGATPA